ncbi:hypothetical protein [Streptomyces sp. NPDC005407]|uniref:hypothetical protein n=1 Tax=Streptomyces sp. NPDC005407 TaxID=3155340 RepID=UPI0033BC4B04
MVRGQPEVVVRGWVVRRPQIPDEVAVEYANGRVYRLTPDGGRIAVVGAGR